MGGKGGGAWKVAYADFVTAMMAFFMVMWLVSQDQKVKESVAKYFIAPTGVDFLGESTRPMRAGGVFDSERAGPVPESVARAAGRNLGSLPYPDLGEPPTMVVGEWYLENPESAAEWFQTARAELAAAEKNPDVIEKVMTSQQAARRTLAEKMRSSLQKPAEQVKDPVLHDLLLSTLKGVDWELIADDCLEQVLERGPLHD